MERDDLKEYIAKNRDAFDEEELPDFSFEAVQRRIRRAPKKNIILRNRLYLAAAVVLMVATVSWLFLQPQENHSAEVYVAQKKPELVVPTNKTESDLSPSTPSTANEEVIHIVKNTTKNAPNAEKMENLLAGLGNPSSSTRLMTVLKLGEQPELNSTQIDALSQQLIQDDNGNVRLASLEVLSNYIHLKEVQFAILKSMIDQRDPIVQMEIIHMTERLNSPEINSLYASLVKNEDTSQPVQEAAYFALASNSLR